MTKDCSQQNLIQGYLQLGGQCANLCTMMPSVKVIIFKLTLAYTSLKFYHFKPVSEFSEFFWDTCRTITTYVQM